MILFNKLVRLRNMQKVFQQFVYTQKKGKLEICQDTNKLHMKIKKKIHSDKSLVQKFIQDIQIIKKMRLQKQAPVDTLGADSNADLKAQTNTQNFQHLISILISVQSKDQVTNKVMNKLKDYGLTIESMKNIQQSQLKDLIKQTNFNNKKVKNIKTITDIIISQHKGIVPNTYEQIIRLPGVGPKIANIFMKVAYNKVTGIGVDTHVHRIANRLRWVKTKDPTQTQKKLQQLAPKSKWGEINKLVVGFGQVICSKRKPNCKQCELIKSCPAYKFNDF